MRVANLNSPRTNKPVANQYEMIDDNGVAYFQSYSTIIAKRDNWVYTISQDWNYSRTTSKYFAEWLRMYGFNNFEIETLKKWLRKAKAGDELVELLGGRVNIKLVEAISE